MQFTEVLEYLIKNKYILASQGKYTLSKAFQDMATKVKRDRENGVQMTVVPPQERFNPPVLPSMTLDELKRWQEEHPGNVMKQLPVGEYKHTYDIKKSMVPFPTMPHDWPMYFIQFIAEAKVPARLEGSRGEEYSANKYSEDGMKAFRKAIESGVDYGVLVRSTMLYYKSSTRFKKTIGNYMANGDWRTDYEALRSAAIDGTTAIEQYIKQETKDNGHNPYRLG